MHFVNRLHSLLDLAAHIQVALRVILGRGESSLLDGRLKHSSAIASHVAEQVLVVLLMAVDWRVVG